MGRTICPSDNAFRHTFTTLLGYIQLIEGGAMPTETKTKETIRRDYPAEERTVTRETKTVEREEPRRVEKTTVVEKEDD
jgi:hypothetical protein